MTTTIYITDPIVLEQVISNWDSIANSVATKIDTEKIINDALLDKQQMFTTVFKQNWHSIVNGGWNEGGGIKNPGAYVTGATEAAISSYVNGVELIYQNPSETKYFWIWGNQPQGAMFPDFTSTTGLMAVGKRSGNIFAIRATVARYDGHPRMMEIINRTRNDIITIIKPVIIDMLKIEIKRIIKEEIVAMVK